MSKLCPLAMTLCLAALGCGSDDEPAPDAGPVDTGVVVATDGGVPSKCPIPGNKMDCTSNIACLSGGEQLTPAPSNCGPFCPPRAITRSVEGQMRPLVCAVGECSTPETILLEEPLSLLMSRGGLVSVTHFVVVTMYGLTTGGARLTCADVMADPTAFFEDECYTVVDVRGLITAGNPGAGDTFTFSVSRIPASTPAVSVIYGFDSDDTSVAPIGMSCTEYDVGAPGSGMGEAQQIGLNEMKLIQ